MDGPLEKAKRYLADEADGTLACGLVADLVAEVERLRALLRAVVQEADRSTRAFNEAREFLKQTEQ
jgi:hypothetical protein